MDTVTVIALGRLAWDHLLGVAAEMLDEPEYRLLVLTHVLSSRPDDMDAGQVLELLGLLARAGVI